MQLAQLNQWTLWLEWFLKMAVQTLIFSCLVWSRNHSPIPPRVIQSELKEKIIHLYDIDNVRFTSAGSIIISTKIVECAIDVCFFSEFMIEKRVVLENKEQISLIQIPSGDSACGIGP